MAHSAVLVGAGSVKWRMGAERGLSVVHCASVSMQGWSTSASVVSTANADSMVLES